VVFTLDNGRRKEALAQHQAANALDTQLAVNRQVLMQQLGESADPVTMSMLSRSRGGLPGGDGNVGGLPMVGGGAVGYQPVIMWLPQGASMSVTAVVSADRRYVRITATPFFSGVSQVNTFNTTNGASTGGGGGIGGNSGGSSNSGFNPNSGSGGSGIGSGGVF
jgi:hypothetical protein